MLLLPNYCTSYESRDRPDHVAEALNKAANKGDEYHVVQRPDGRWIINYYNNGLLEGPL